jgi:hypothetical protein
MIRPASVLGLRWLPFLFLAVMLGILAYGWHALAQNAKPPSSTTPLKGAPLEDGARTNDPAPSPDALRAEQSRIGYEQDALEKRVAMLQAQLGWVLAAVGLFTLVQGAFAAFGAHNFVQQADRIMSDMKDRQKAAIEQLNEHSRQMAERGETAVKSIEALALDVRARYPMFHRAEQARREAFESLGRLIENGDWREGLYEQLGVLERQRLLSVENFVGLEFLESDSNLAGDLRLMGNFYASKYVSEERKNLTDLDRAQYYLELALNSTGRAFHHLNDYGLLHLEIMRPAKPDIAKSQFQESRRKRQHQRAAYNLACIAHDCGNAATEPPEKVRHYREAHDLLKEALGHDVWELTKSTDREGGIHYNLACCLARLSECDRSVDARKRLAGALAELEIAARIGITKRKTLLHDLEDADGDLTALSKCSDPSIRTSLVKIRSLFDEVWAKKGISLV